MALLEVKEISIDLGEFNLKNISLKVERRDYITIIGPTGSGKTLLIETVAGFYRPASGRILLNNIDITEFPPEKRGMSIVYQDYMLFPHMNIYDNIAYGLRKKTRDKNEIKREVEHISEVLRISHLLYRMPLTLSGGEQQRVAIARALVVKPKLLLMDEPFSALDVKTKEDIRSLVKKAVREYEATVLHITHDFEDVFTLANKVIVMKNGMLLQTGSPEDVFSRPVENFVADFVGTNVLDCRVMGSMQNLTVLKCGEVTIYTADKAEGRVKVSVRPEEIIVSANPIKTSARNMFKGSIIEMSKRGQMIWLFINAGIMLKVVITPSSAEALGISEKKEVYVMFKAAAVKVIK